MKWRSLEEAGPVCDLRPLGEIFAERKALIAKYVPAENQAIHARVIEELKGSGMVERALGIGARAPSFELSDQNGRVVSSVELLSKGRLVICFLRGRWCPFCVGQMEAMNVVVGEIERAGASLVAISPQTVQQAFFMVDQHKLRFPLLSDVGSGVGRQFGLVIDRRISRESIGGSFVNLPFANGDESWELPIPATYVLDRDGTVLFASANADYAERAEPLDVLKSLR